MLKKFPVFLLLSICLLPLTITRANNPISINLLLVLDQEYGANYHYIRDIFESSSCNEYSWNITVTGLYSEIYPCNYQADSQIVTVDILISEIKAVSVFHCLSIMPGNSHTNLIENNESLHLIQEAVNKSLVVTAWCKAVKVLAKANVLSGRNVTGPLSIKEDCEEAGAKFISNSPPIRNDKNNISIITSVRSRYYRRKTCELIASACYEKLGIKIIEPNSGTTSWIGIQSLVVFIPFILWSRRGRSEKYE